VHRALRDRFVPWAGHWRYVTLDEMREFLRPFREVTLRTVGFLGALGRTRRQRQWLGGVDRLGLDALVPSAWRYLVCGVARR